MTRIKMAVSAALVAAAGLVGVQAAQAATAPGTAPTDLLVAVWNSTTNTSVVIDLTSTTWANLNSTSSFQSAAGYTQSWTLDLSGLGTTTSADNFSIFAAQGTSVPQQAMLGLSSLPAALSTPALTSNVIGGIQQYMVTNLPGTTTSVVGTSTNGAYWASSSAPINPGVNGGSYNTSYLNNLGMGTAGTQGLNFYEWTAGPTRGNATVAAVGNSTGPGLFTLSGNTLTYTLAAASAVPLPAAGWLLLSGLLGLGAVGRRRDAAVAA